MNSIYQMEEILQKTLPKIIAHIRNEFENSEFSKVYSSIDEAVDGISRGLLEYIKDPSKDILLPPTLSYNDIVSYPIKFQIKNIKSIRNIFIQNITEHIDKSDFIKYCLLITSFFDKLEEAFINNINPGSLSIKELNVRLQKIHRIATIGKASGTVAHEFNNILTIIKNWAQLGLIEKDEEIRLKSFESIVKNSERGAEITRSMLNFCRNMENKSLFTNINNFIDELLITIEKKLGKEEIEIERNYSILPDISIDRFGLREAFFNILLNCCDSLKRNPKKITIITRVKEGKIEIIFSDNGEGITLENQKRLFEPFFTTVEKSEFSTGLGLGLNIALNIVREHGGDIKITSEYGKGTNTIISIPII